MICRNLLCGLLFIGALTGLRAQDGGMMPRWEVISLAQQIDLETRVIEKLLTQVRPAEWIERGAPEIYVEEIEKLKGEVSNLSLSARALERDPEKLSSAIDTFLWSDRVGSMVASIAAGVRKYQNAAVAELLEAVRNRMTGPEAQLKEYMRQLAVERENELDIANSEAQRCRERLARETPSGR